MLNIHQIQHYPIGGENALKVQFVDPSSKKHLGIESLEYGLITGFNHFFESKSLFFNVSCDNGLRHSLNLSEIKPLLRPLSDLYKERNGKIDIVELAKMVTNMMIHVDQISFDDTDDCVYAKVHGHDDNDKVVVFGFNNGEFWLAEKHTGKFINQLQLFQYLFENHYDVFSLIEKGLAIDINTI